LADNSVISKQQLTQLLDQLPRENTVSVSAPPASTLRDVILNGNGAPNEPINEKSNYYNHAPVQSQPPPPPAYNQTPAVLTYATALYPYNATDAGDLSLGPNDRVAVTEYMNGEWWKGRNERTGQEGIFPRSYVRVEEKGGPPPPPGPSSYGNVPQDVAQQEQPKDKSTVQKIGGKLGNAAIFGAGGKLNSTAGRGIVLTVMQRLLEAILSIPSFRRNREILLVSWLSIPALVYFRFMGETLQNVLGLRIYEKPRLLDGHVHCFFGVSQPQ
jgi:LAS seventeen-binding protein 1/2